MSEDPRLGLPSASSFALDALCAGRQQLLREIGDVAEPVDEDAQRGTNLHKAWQDAGTPNLSLFEDKEDEEIYERGLKLVEQVLDGWNSWRTNKEPSAEGTREERFYLHDDKGNIAASGQADRHYTAGDFVLVIDFKSLWCRSLVPSERNWQARLLSVLVAREYGAIHVRFAFLKAMFGKSDIVDYTAEDLERAQYSIQQILWESRQPGAQRRPGLHCRHCKAASGCPEAAAWQMLPSVQAKAQGEGITPTVATELVANISLLDCVKIWDSSTARHNIENACKARLKALPEPELAELGLIFGKPKTLRPITNVAGAFEFLINKGVPLEKIWSVTKMSNGELETVVQESLGLKSKKEAQAYVRLNLKDFITEQVCEKPLEKV